MVMENDVKKFRAGKIGVGREGAMNIGLLERENILEREREHEIKR